MYLIDTNIWLELLLVQENASEVQQFMQTIEEWQMSISEFSLYSIGIILTRQKRDRGFRDFISDTLEDTTIGRVRLETPDLNRLLDVRRQFNLDFDDAYQYAVGKNTISLS